MDGRAQYWRTWADDDENEAVNVSSQGCDALRCVWLGHRFSNAQPPMHVRRSLRARRHPHTLLHDMPAEITCYTTPSPAEGTRLTYTAACCPRPSPAIFSSPTRRPSAPSRRPQATTTLPATGPIPT